MSGHSGPIITGVIVGLPGMVVKRQQPDFL